MDRHALIKELVYDEGEVLYAYQDSAGYWTIGVGQLIDRRKGGRISQAASRFMLNESIDEKINDLDEKLPWWRQLSEVRQRVLINMCFNLGIRGLLGFKNTLAAMKAGDYDRAAKAMLNSKWAKQVGKRAQRLAFMIVTDKEAP